MNETVAERLIRQGKEYKSKRSELRNQLLKEEDGEYNNQHKPTLSANSQMYVDSEKRKTVLIPKKKGQFNSDKYLKQNYSPEGKSPNDFDNKSDEDNQAIPVANVQEKLYL
jgi:hypothetical protein